MVLEGDVGDANRDLALVRYEVETRLLRPVEVMARPHTTRNKVIEYVFLVDLRHHRYGDMSDMWMDMHMDVGVNTRMDM